MAEFWISWYSPEPMSAFEMHSPWWVSGYTGDGAQNIVVAAIRAEDEDAAWAYVRSCYDCPSAEITERFIEPLTGDPFSARFTKQSWMGWSEASTCGCRDCAGGAR